MARRLAAGQHKMILRYLVTNLQRNQHEKRSCRWVIAVIALTLTLILAYLTSRSWRRPLLEFASRYAWRRTRVPARVPVPKPRDARTCALSMIDEDCAMEMEPIMGTAGGISGDGAADLATPVVNTVGSALTTTEDTGGNRAATLPKSLGVRYSQPG
jgi:hypothetical protein